MSDVSTGTDASTMDPSTSTAPTSTPSSSGTTTTPSSVSESTSSSPSSTSAPPTTSTPSSTPTPTPTPTSSSTTLSTPFTTSTTSSTPSTTTPTPTPTPSSSSSSSIETSSSEPPPTTSSTPPTTTSPISSSFTTSTGSPTETGSTKTTTITSFATPPPGTHTASSTATNGSPTLLPGQGGSSSSGLDKSGKIAVAVVVPIAGVALLVIAGLFFWRRRKQRKIAEEQRRKEAEDYAYNPNNDPTLPNVGGAGSYEMKGESASGYRGWGSTALASSTGRKGSTTLSGGQAGLAYSDSTTITRGTLSDSVSGEPLISDGSRSPEGEILGAMGPSSADNRGGNVHRGPSNASSSYSAAGRSDGSGEGLAYGGTGYYDQYGNNPYSDPYSDGGNAPAQPVIRDNPARRNTRIENSSHYPQQSAGISQNF